MFATRSEPFNSRRTPSPSDSIGGDDGSQNGLTRLTLYLCNLVQCDRITSNAVGNLVLQRKA